MELGSQFVGIALRDYVRKVSWRETMNYAAAVGDDNPVYFDDEQEDGIVAPPLFPVAVTWPVCERIWEFMETDDFPFELLATQVHYTEHIAFHRPIRPGDNLTVKGKIAAILPHRAGTLVVIRFDALDPIGNPVFTEHNGALLRGVTCSDNGCGGENLPTLYPVPERRDPIWSTKIPIDPLRPYIYDGCTNIVFPIHTSKKLARDVGLSDIILQGTATLAYAMRELCNREADGRPDQFQSVSCRFNGMIVPGSEIQIELIQKIHTEDGTHLHFTVIDHEGHPVVTDDHARMFA